KIPGIRATVGQMLNRARNAVWPQDSFAPRPPKRFLRFLLALLVISAMAGGGAVLLRMTGYDLSAEAWSTTQVTAAAQNRLKSIAYSLDSARDWLSGDAPLLAAVAQRNTAQLFQLLAERDNEFSSRLPDSVRFGNPGTNRGYAVYSTDGKLLAWYSPVAATFGFDTTLAGDFLLPSHDRGLLLENGPIYAYLIAIRKIVSPNGQIQAYVASKQLLATKEPLTGNAASSVFDDIPAHAHRDLTFVFGAPLAPDLDRRGPASRTSGHAADRSFRDCHPCDRHRANCHCVPRRRRQSLWPPISGRHRLCVRLGIRDRREPTRALSYQRFCDRRGGNALDRLDAARTAGTRRIARTNLGVADHPGHRVTRVCRGRGARFAMFFF